jgi:azurin
MKNLTTIATILFVALLYSCSGGNNNENANRDTTATTPSTSELMKEEPAYSATTIDPNAKVVDVTIKATGNTMTEMKYDNREIKVPSGCTIHIKFINEGTDAAMVHNFVLIEEGAADTVATAGLAAGPSKGYVPSMNKVLYGSKLLQPKEQTEFTIPAPAKGVYDYICTYPGHYKMMNGKLIVE